MGLCSRGQRTGQGGRCACALLRVSAASLEVGREAEALQHQRRRAGDLEAEIELRCPRCKRYVIVGA